jgi:hypothetical protein
MGEKVKLMQKNWTHTLNPDNNTEYSNMSRSNFSASEFKDAQNTNTWHYRMGYQQISPGVIKPTFNISEVHIL